MILGILITLLLPAIAKSKLRAKRAQCSNNLKQQGLAFHLFAHDHNSEFPFAVSTNNGGSLEFMRLATNFGGEIYFSFRHYQALGRDLDTPKILICPTDTRVLADSFANLRNDNLSYFISGTARYENPMSILAGDRNIETYDLGLRSVLRLDPTDLPGWGPEMHQRQGNLLFADSHVEQVNNNGLRAALRTAPEGRTVLLTPIPAPSTATAAATGQAVTGDGTGAGASAAIPVPPGTPASTPGASTAAKTQTPAASPSVGSARKDRSSSPSQPGAEIAGNRTVSSDKVGPNDSGRQTGETAAEANSEYKPDGWPAFIAHYITTLGAKVAWVLLLVILSVLVYLEIRRRRARVLKEHRELANVD
ncbi:MAG: hypothetical protein JWM16_2087 [Verrucomicrobiales bacterium]|nr:hypothetical protein [Verrucomicrobiales bacterium]